MIYSIAIDDEENALGVIRNYCGKIPDLECFGCFSNPEEGLAAIENHPQVNLVFLDIRMPGMNGLELAARLPKHAKIILTTAYSEYAIEGFEMEAIDYLLKPFSFERFLRAIEKFRIITAGPENEAKHPGTLIPRHDDIILVKADHRIVKIRLNELVYVEGAGNYLVLYTMKGKVLTLLTLKGMEEQLAPYDFIRVHKSFLISLLYLESVDKNSVVVNGQEIPVSDSYKEALHQQLASRYRQI
jgi:DNA-binding LytR/AlgR family response regulator